MKKGEEKTYILPKEEENTLLLSDMHSFFSQEDSNSSDDEVHMFHLIDGTYAIEDVIAIGGMSTVYKARHVRVNTLWAIKQIEKKRYHSEQGFSFSEEARLLLKLHNPMFPHVIGIHEDENSYYIIEEYIEGDTLEQFLSKNQRVDGELGVSWFKELCKGLLYLHLNTPPILYLDMKPSNVMLQPDGRLRLLDFGISREMGSDREKKYTENSGTYGYAAPEQLSAGILDARTDIYSLGVTMYHLFTGKSPYDPPYTFLPAHTVVPGLSVGISHILEKCIQDNPDKRYTSVEELMNDLDNYHVYEEAWQQEQLIKHRRRNIRIAVLLMIIAVTTIISITAFQRIGKLRKVVDNLKQAIDISQDITPYEKAKLLISQEKEMDAIKLMDDILLEEPDNSSALLARGEAWLALADHFTDPFTGIEQRMEYYEKAIPDLQKAEEHGEETASDIINQLEKMKEKDISRREIHENLLKISEAIVEDHKETVYDLIANSHETRKNYLIGEGIDWLVFPMSDKWIIATDSSVYVGGKGTSCAEGKGIIAALTSTHEYWLDSEWKDGKPEGKAVEIIESRKTKDYEGEFFLRHIRKGSMIAGTFEGKVHETADFKSYSIDNKGNINDHVYSNLKLEYDMKDGELVPLAESEIPEGVEETSYARLQNGEEAYAYSKKANRLFFSKDFETYEYQAGEEQDE